MSVQQTTGGQQADPFAWARALRHREHELGLGSKAMTRTARAIWRDVLQGELTDLERQTAPGRRRGETQGGR